MSVDMRRKLLKEQLQESMADLDKSIEALDYSFRKCIAIGEKPAYDLEEQESFESLTSRFGRATDIFTQKALKTLFSIIQESVRTKIDAANLAEKLEIVQDANTLLNIRELRNQISHEYVSNNLNTLFMDTLKYVPELKSIVKNFKRYVSRLPE